MADVKPFRVSVPESELKYLRQRLDTARYPDILTNIAPWEDGTDLDYFKVVWCCQLEHAGSGCHQLPQQNSSWQQHAALLTANPWQKTAFLHMFCTGLCTPCSSFLQQQTAAALAM
jgi:hypothetical protein